MSKVVFLSIISLILAFFFGGISYAIDGLTAKTQVVFAAKLIKKGGFFSKQNLEYRPVNQSNLSPIAVCAIGKLLERRASRNIRDGEQVTLQEIMLSDVNKWTSYDEKESHRKPKPGFSKVIYPREVLFQGRPISVCQVVYGERRSSNIPQNAIQHRKQVVGMKPKFDIEVGQVITLSDLIPCDSKKSKNVSTADFMVDPNILEENHFAKFGCVRPKKGEKVQLVDINGKPFQW